MAQCLTGITVAESPPCGRRTGFGGPTPPERTPTPDAIVRVALVTNPDGTRPPRAPSVCEQSARGARSVGGDGEEALVDELLHPLRVVDLGRVDVALPVHRHVVDPVELARIAPAPREARQHLAVVAQEEPHVVVLAVRGVEEGLPAIR